MRGKPKVKSSDPLLWTYEVVDLLCNHFTVQSRRLKKGIIEQQRSAGSSLRPESIHGPVLRLYRQQSEDTHMVKTC